MARSDRKKNRKSAKVSRKAVNVGDTSRNKNHKSGKVSRKAVNLADSSHNDAVDDYIIVRLMEMVRAHDFAGLQAAVRDRRYLAKAELVSGLGTRLIH